MKWAKRKGNTKWLNKFKGQGKEKKNVCDLEICLSRIAYKFSGTIFVLFQTSENFQHNCKCFALIFHSFGLGFFVFFLVFTFAIRFTNDCSFFSFFFYICHFSTICSSLSSFFCLVFHSLKLVLRMHWNRNSMKCRVNFDDFSTGKQWSETNEQKE